MENKQILVVKFNAQKMNKGMLVCFGVALLSLCASYLLPHHLLAPIFPRVFSLGAQIYMIMAIFFFICLLFGFFSTNKKDPVFIFSDEGVWVQYFGMIAWHEIAEVGEYAGMANKEASKAFGIMLKDPIEISKRASWQGRSRLWGAKVCKQAHILMPNLDTPTYEILCFTHKFMNR